MELSEKIKTFEEVSEEIITREDLIKLLMEKEHPLAYDGFEPSGIAHLPLLFRAITIKKLLTTGVRFKLFLADWHAWLNGKLGGNLDAIKAAGWYFVEAWKAAGVPVQTDEVEIVWSTDILDRDYTTTMLRVANYVTVSRVTRALPIMGRTAVESDKVAWLFYPVMQVTDIFKLGVDICQLGLDQRKANMLAREVAEKLGRKKPVGVHHHILVGLEGLKSGKGMDEDAKRDAIITSKMSKSSPRNTIYLTDDEDVIRKKILSAACPPAVLEGNPIIEYAKYIVFPLFGEIKVERDLAHGGDVTYKTFEELARDYASQKLHPLDLKLSLARELNRAIEPIRRHLTTDNRARELWDAFSPYLPRQ
ncbi:MAG: tyrosine--tRNA ligase [Thermoprotei archaeon]